MRFYRYFAAVLILLLVLPSEAGVAGYRAPKKQKELLELRNRNARLQATVDSLRSVQLESEMKIDSLSRKLDEYRDKFFFNRVVKRHSQQAEDSLVKLWYVKQSESFSAMNGGIPEKFKADVPDSVLIDRLRKMDCCIDLSYNNLVRNYCMTYSGKYKAFIGEMLELLQYYDPIFEEVFSEYDVPFELKILAIIESHLRHDLTSKAGAKGVWQFVLIAAKGYNLRVDGLIDERLDPVKSTRAAAKLLRDVYDIYGDWTLSIASYNCGLGNIRKAIARSGGSHNYWDLYPYLPSETRNYIPAFIGMAYALYYHKELGISPTNTTVAMPIDTFVVHKNLNFKSLSTILGVSNSTVKSLNPQYLCDVIPESKDGYVLRLPIEYTQAFINFEDSLYTHSKQIAGKKVAITKNVGTVSSVKSSSPRKDNRVVHIVRSGEVLSRISVRYGVKVADIKKWNGLKSDNLKVGQKLTIYTH